MLIGKTIDEVSKKNRLVIGFDLGNDFSQISFCRTDQSMPDTFSMVTGEEQYNIPTVLCKGKDVWFIGKEALQQASAGQGTLVEDIVLLAKNNTSAPVGDEEYEPEKLLAIFIKKALFLLSAFHSLDDIAGIAFTMHEMNPQLMTAIRAAVTELNLKKTEVYFLSKQDCFFQYMIHQPEEMWIHDVILYDYRREGIYAYRLQLNRKTRPVVCYMEKSFHPQMKMAEVSSMKAAQKNAFFTQLDDAFLELAREQCEGNMISSVFLLGDIFSKDWCKESVRYLCHGRRVFQGNNLFSKGACYGARERVLPSSLSDTYVFLSEDKLKANIGMPCNKGQEEIYMPLLHGGTNWYEAQKEMDLILARNNKLSLSVTPLDGGQARIAEITLDGLYVRGNKTNRIGFQIQMTDENTVQIEITDKGFGEFFPSTGQIWKESFSLEQFSSKGT